MKVNPKHQKCINLSKKVGTERNFFTKSKVTEGNIGDSLQNFPSLYTGQKEKQS